MKYFKLEASCVAPKYEINRENFNNLTHKRNPFVQTDKNGGGITCYAICPSCLNPIQLVGIVRDTKCRPYGKHTGERVQGLVSWSQKSYEYCPYAVKNARRKPNDDEPPLEVDEHIIELYDLLKENFDRAVLVIGETLGIRGSAAFWRKALRQFLANELYGYAWLTEDNLPYIFAYWGLLHQNLYGQKIRSGTNLCRALEKCQNVRLEHEDSSGYRRVVAEKDFLSLQLRFYQHRQEAVDGEQLKESMICCVDDMKSNTVLYEEEVEFDEQIFMNLVRSNGKRIQFLLDIASEMMPPLLLSETATQEEPLFS